VLTGVIGHIRINNRTKTVHSYLYCITWELPGERNQDTTYCKTLFFRRILISLFPYLENLLHFNFVDFPINFIKQFVSYFFRCLKHMLLLLYPVLLFTLILPRLLHTISRKSWYSVHTKLWRWAFKKFTCI